MALTQGDTTIPVKNVIILLYETTGFAALPFIAEGFEVHCYDKLNKNEVRNGINFHYWDALTGEPENFLAFKNRVRFLFGFPPCTDLAVSGAKHFKSKAKENINFQQDAMKLVLLVPEIGEKLGVPWGFENPVSMVSTLFRKPDFIFHPCHYGGWLPENDVHPEYPRYIAPRDAYPKTTCIWTGNGFKKPKTKYVDCPPGWSKQTTLLGGKSEKTKRIRSASPRGFFTAIAKQLKEEK